MAMNGSEDEGPDEGLLQLKEKSKEQKEKEEAEYIDWLRGKKADIKDPSLKKNMATLHDYWTDPSLPESERFLRDYILNRRYVDNEDESGEDSDAPAQAADAVAKVEKLDFVEFSDEEKIIENQEEFERKYNFRFEEPDPEFIKSYPRTIVDSARREKTKRREKREEVKKRKELEKVKRREEIKRLKNLKRMEIAAKIDRLRRVSGKKELKLSEEDLEKEFDPDEYERRMQELFDEDWCGPDEAAGEDDNEDDKPVFTDDEEEDEKCKQRICGLH
jgi:protein KRI1